jgi:hypothetical protein
LKIWSSWTSCLGDRHQQRVALVRARATLIESRNLCAPRCIYRNTTINKNMGGFAMRVRTWIRNGDFDAVIDFDAAVAIPTIRRGFAPTMTWATTCTRTTPAIARWGTRLT